MMTELDKWWCSLTTQQKEHIASRIETKRLGVPTEISYPVTTRIWQEQSDTQKEQIHRHCTDSHGYLLPEYTEGKTFSY